MYPAPFTYHRAASLADVHRMLADQPDAKLLAGGHSLLPLMKLRLATAPALIDIGRVPELKGIGTSGGGLRLGAATTHAELAASADVRRVCPVLAETAAHIGDPAVRNRGTIGGSLAHADPGADLPTVLVAVDASVEVSGPGGSRTIPASDFGQGLMTTALGPGEVITAVLVPAATSATGAAYSKLPHPASRYAVLGAAASITLSGGTCTAARVVVGGLVPRPVRLPSVEKALVGASLQGAAVAAASAHAIGDLAGDLIGDVFASAEYRRAVAPVHVGRAVEAAVARLR